MPDFGFDGASSSLAEFMFIFLFFSFVFNRVFAIKIVQPIIPSKLKKAKFIPASL